MKKLLNRYSIFMFILGILVCSISVYAYSIGAEEVSYSPSDTNFNANNVNTALNTLYARSKSIYDKIDGTHLRNYYIGNRVNNKVTSLTLPQGKYHVYLNFTQSWGNTTNSFVGINTIEDLSSVISINKSNTSCEYINNQCSRQVATTAQNNGVYANLISCDLIMKCVVESSNGTISTTYLDADSNYVIVKTSINSIKIE